MRQEVSIRTAKGELSKCLVWINEIPPGLKRGRTDFGQTSRVLGRRKQVSKKELEKERRAMLAIAKATQKKFKRKDPK